MAVIPPVPGEDLAQTAIRETVEETGIRTEFVAVLCFRHMRSYRWGTDDLYFACLLRPLNTDITINPTEIADAKWMDVRKLLLTVGAVLFIIVKSNCKFVCFFENTIISTIVKCVTCV